MTEFQITLKNDLDRQIDAYEVHLAARRGASERRNVFIVVTLALILVSWLGIGSRDSAGLEGFWPWILLSMGVAALAAWSPASWGRAAHRRQIKAHWDKLGLEDRQTVYRFDDARIIIEDDVFGGKIAWSEIHSWHEDDRFMLFYRAPEFFYFLEKSAVDPNALGEFVKRLKSSPAKQL